MLVWQKGATVRGVGERTRERQIWLRISPGRERMGEVGEAGGEDILLVMFVFKVLVLVMERTMEYGLWRYRIYKTSRSCVRIQVTIPYRATSY